MTSGVGGSCGKVGSIGAPGSGACPIAFGSIGAPSNGAFGSAGTSGKAVAVLTTADALSIGVSGPVARASGLDLDLRRDTPLLAYPELSSLIDIPVATAGDIPTRYQVLLAQIPVSIAVACAAADRLRALGEGPVNVPLPKVVRAPESTSYREFEGPLGRSGYLLSSVGEKTPWRLKLRTPSFTNVQALARALPGTQLAALAPAVTSFFFVVGDIDR